jgi:HK97 family phage major capsid protein
MEIPAEVEKALKAMAVEAAEKAVSSRPVVQPVAAPAPVIKSLTTRDLRTRMGARLQKAYVEQYGAVDSRMSREQAAQIHAFAEKAGLFAGTADSGSQLVPVPLSDEIIVPLREQSVLLAAGCPLFTDYPYSLDFGKMTAGVTLAWGAENAAPSASSAATTKVTLSSYHVAGYLQVSNQALKTSPDVAAAVAGDVTSALVAEFDAKALAGTGSNSQPTGILGQIHADNTNDATTSATNATIRANLANALKLVRAASNDATMRTGFWAMGPAVFYSLLGKSDTNGAYAFPDLHNTMPTLFGFPVHVTSALSTSVLFGVASCIFLGAPVNEVGTGIQGTDLVGGTTTVYARMAMDAKLKYDKCAASIDAVGVAGWY